MSCSLSVYDFPPLPSTAARKPLTAQSCKNDRIVVKRSRKKLEVEQEVEASMEAVNKNPVFQVPDQTITVCFPQMMKIPIEIREMIWEAAMRESTYLSEFRLSWGERSLMVRSHLVDSVQIRSCNTDGDPLCPSFLPTLCQIPALREETLPVFIRSSTFMIGSFPGNTFFQSFLSSIADGMAHVRHLQFDNFDWFPEGV
jgi:hypothetical protein